MLISDMIKYWEWSTRQYWQYQRRGSWKYRWHGDTLVRYVEVAPADPDFTAGLLEWLKTPESVHGFSDAGQSYAGMTVYNRPANLGAAWKPVSAWYEQQEGQVDERTKLKVIRVYQALQKATEEGSGDGPYTVENGCRYKVTFTYHWKVESLPEVPQGTSGVSYTLEQISRDDETGLWSCCVVKRERVQQDVAEYTAEVTEFETRTEEQHLGVKAGSVAGVGKAAKASNGVLVKRSVRKNEDCTSDVTNETVTERQVEGAAKTVERTLRAETVTVEDRNMAAKLPETGLKPGERVRNEKTPGGRWNRQKTVTTPKIPDGPVRETCKKTAFEHQHAKVEVKENAGGAVDVQEAGGGKVRTETVRALDDGTYEKETEERAEIAAEGAVEETRKTLRGVKKTRVHRNMPAKADTGGMKIGGVVRNEKTEGGLWNQTVEEVEATPTGKIDETCRKTALNHVHQRITNVAADPGAADAQEAAGGTIHRIDVRRTEEGTFDVTEETDTAVPATDTVTAGSTGRTEVRTEYRNAQEIEPPEPSENVEVSAQVRTNEHGLKDGTVAVVTHVPVMKTASGGSTSRAVTVEAGINQTEEPQGSPSENVEVSVDVSPNEHGSMTTRKQTVTHVPVMKTASGGSTSRAVTVEAGINQTEVPTGSPSTNVEVSVDVSPNEHGSMTTRKQTVTHSKETAQATGGSALYTEVEEAAINDTQQPSETPATGTVVTCRAQPNGHGSFSTSKVTRTAKAAHETKTWTTADDNYTYTHTVDVYRNQQSVPSVPSGCYQANMSLSINEYGLIDAIVTTVNRVRKSGTGDPGESITGTEKRFMYYQDKDGKMHRRQVTANFTARRETGNNLHTIMLNGAESGLGFHSHDNGSFGIKYTNITVGAEEDVT